MNKDIDEEIITCIDYTFDTNKLNLDHKNKVYNYDELLDDPRRLCTYYNRYFGDSSRVLYHYYKAQLFQYNYEELLSIQHNDSIYIGQESPSKRGYMGYMDCGELDTFKKSFIFKGYGMSHKLYKSNRRQYRVLFYQF
jgi:hypothetical protein